MRQVEDVLIVGISMDRSHQTLDDTEVLHQDLGDRGEAVGRAGSVGNDVVLGWIIQVGVDAHADSPRGTDDDLAGPGLDVFTGIRALCEEAGRFDDDIDAECFPGEGARVSFREHLDRFAVDINGIGFRCDFRVEDAVNGVVFK